MPIKFPPAQISSFEALVALHPSMLEHDIGLRDYSILSMFVPTRVTEVTESFLLTLRML